LLAFAEVAALPFTVRERPPWHTLLYLEKRLPVYPPAHGGSPSRRPTWRRQRSLSGYAWRRRGPEPLHASAKAAVA